MNSPWLLFLHGINDGGDELWRVPLNDALSRFGRDAFPEDRILTPDYRAALRGQTDGAAMPPTTWERPPKDQWRRATTDYLARMAELEARLRPLANAEPLRVKPPELVDVPPAVSLVEAARRYARSHKVKATVLSMARQSLDVLPDGSRIVILAHSLGTVVAADLLTRLPATIEVLVLVTMGSPLGAIETFRPRALDQFPCDKVRAWVNVFEPRDPVTGGRGVSQYFPNAIDVPVTLNDWYIPAVTHQHGAQFYCSHGAVAATITHAISGHELTTCATEAVEKVTGLELFLLQSLYLRELAKRIPTDDAERLARLERARRVVAAKNGTAAAFVHAQNPETDALPASEFLQRPDAHIRGAWDDPTVLALVIMLASSPPAAPFQIEEKADTEERRLALIATLSLIRVAQTDHTDVDIVDAVFSAQPEVAEALGGGRSWVPGVLVTAGVLTLAATGVGLVVAAPAGLAGAAVVGSW